MTSARDRALDISGRDNECSLTVLRQRGVLRALSRADDHCIHSSDVTLVLRAPHPVRSSAAVLLSSSWHEALGLLLATDDVH